MKKTLVFGFIAATFLVASALAQTPGIPPGPVPGAQPMPKQQPQPRPEDLKKNPGRPIPPQSSLPVTNFAASNQRCLPSLQGATLTVTANLGLQPNPVTGNTAQIDLLIDGVSVGAVGVRTRNPFPYRRDIQVRGASGAHEAVFVLDGVVRSAPFRFEHTCISGRPTKADTPGQITLPQETNVAAIVPVKDGLRPGGIMRIEIESTDGRSALLVSNNAGVPDNSVLRIEGQIPYRLTRETLHRVRLNYFQEGARGATDTTDNVHVQWLVLEAGAPRAAMTRVYESGTIASTMSPKQWWQSYVVSQRRVPGDLTISRMWARIYTGADDLRVRTYEGTWFETHSILELSLPISNRPSISGVSTPAGANATEEVLFGNLDFDPGPGARAATMNVREFRSYRMWNAFGLRPARAHEEPAFKSYGEATIGLDLPANVRLRDIGLVSINADLGRKPYPRDNLNVILGGAILDDDEWDYAGAQIGYIDPRDGSHRILYSDRVDLRIREPRRFYATSARQNIFVAGR